MSAILDPRAYRTLSRRKIAAIGVAAFHLAASALFAQGWRGTGRAQGVVLDEERRPVGGATVTLRAAEEGGGPPPISTDRRGRWSALGLAAGSWRIVVAADGFVASEGEIALAEGPNPPLTVQLLPLAATVGGMLERGNRLLATGDVAAARALYETALGGLAREDSPEVLRAIARTHYLERDLAAAERALRQALLLVPDDAVTRQLLVAVAAEAGRSDELAAWLAALARDGAARLLAESGGPLGLRPPEAPLRQAGPEVRGRFRTRFTERHPLGAIETFSARYGTPIEAIAATDRKAAAYELADETFELYVPESCAPEAPCGVFVWVSPGAWGGITDREIVPELERRGLIWIGANRSGNTRLLWDRIALALDAASNVLRTYPTDPARVWAGGYSGGGRTASALAVLYPELFRGALCFMGVDFYRPAPIPSRPGAHWPPAFAEPPASALDPVRERSRFAFVTGQLDYNRAQTEIYLERYRDDGFRHLELVVLPGLTHYDGFPAEAFARGMRWLEPAR